MQDLILLHTIAPPLRMNRDPDVGREPGVVRGPPAFDSLYQAAILIGHHVSVASSGARAML